MTKNQGIALAVFIVFSFIVFALVPPPVALVERPVEDGVLLGTFEGTTPCADCPGIVQRLTLVADDAYGNEGTYELSLTYLERDVEPFVESGRWKTERGTNSNPDAEVYALYRNEGAVLQRFLRVDSDTVRILDQEGNEIDSDLPFDLTLVAEGASGAIMPNGVTRTGVMTCLPHKDTTGPQTLECALGLEGDDGNYYVLDLAALSEEDQMLATGDSRLGVSGVLMPIEILSTNQWMRYNVQGIIRVESLQTI